MEIKSITPVMISTINAKEHFPGSFRQIGSLERRKSPETTVGYAIDCRFVDNPLTNCHGTAPLTLREPQSHGKTINTPSKGPKYFGCQWELPVVFYGLYSAPIGRRPAPATRPFLFPADPDLPFSGLGHGTGHPKKARSAQRCGSRELAPWRGSGSGAPSGGTEAETPPGSRAGSPGAASEICTVAGTMTEALSAEGDQ